MVEHDCVVRRDFSVKIVSPSQLIAAGLAALLKESGFMAVTGGSPPADVALVDARRFAASPIVRGVPSVALLSDEAEPSIILRMGYRGYLRPPASPELLVRALTAVHGGDTWAERNVLQDLAFEPKSGDPTIRERAVLYLLAKGNSNGKIAKELGITVSTVKAHITSLLGKHRVHSRLELVALYYDRAGSSKVPANEGAPARRRSGR